MGPYRYWSARGINEMLPKYFPDRQFFASTTFLGNEVAENFWDCAL